MRKHLFMRIVLIVLVVLLGVYSYAGYIQSNKQAVAIYTKSIIEIINLGAELHSDKRQFAINSDTLQGLSATEKSEVLNSISNIYNVIVVDSSYTELVENGFEKKGEPLKSLVLYIEDVKKYGPIMRVYLAKEYGSLGANGVVIDFVYVNGIWKFWRITHTWIA